MSATDSVAVLSTALVIAVPEADARFGDLRRRWDPQAAQGVPAHFTILFPFLPPERVDPDVRRKLKLLCRRHSPFRCVLDRVGRFPATAYLAPVIAAPFIELTNAVAREFPECPPYAGAHTAIVPHLTIAHGDVRAADEAQAALEEELRRNGPVASHCGSVRLLENSSGTWRALDEFALVGHQG